MEPYLHLVLGGSRSGKSRRAEELTHARGGPVTYIATYIPANGDAEMEERVLQHRQRRPAHWTTIENSFDLKSLFDEHRRSLILLDCLTMWLSYRQMGNLDEESILSELEAALQSFSPECGGLIIVSNEVGCGLVPSSAEGRKFRDLAGRGNQLVARFASRVELMVAGLPLLLKGDQR